jgi:cyclopropane-fatty-acyl-phospholipid synthase
MATQADIQYHYDVDNDFYALFLDKIYRAYSCGVWKSANSLEEAQEHKIQRICQFANVASGAKIIDIGCGWGGLMQVATSQFGAATAHGLTLSTDQFNYVSGLRKLGQTISVDLCSWQDYKPPENTRYDAIASVGAFEHFASLEDRSVQRQRAVYRNFFEWCKKNSTSDAQIGLQTIVTARVPSNLKEIVDVRYLLEKVFPGSALPTISDIQAATVDLYEFSSVKRIGLDYARTLEEWKMRLKQSHETHAARFDEGLFHHYETYFDSAIRNFKSGVVDLFQVSLKPIRPLRIFQ